MTAELTRLDAELKKLQEYNKHNGEQSETELSQLEESFAHIFIPSSPLDCFISTSSSLFFPSSSIQI